MIKEILTCLQKNFLPTKAFLKYCYDFNYFSHGLSFIKYFLYSVFFTRESYIFGYPVGWNYNIYNILTFINFLIAFLWGHLVSFFPFLKIVDYFMGILNSFFDLVKSTFNYLHYLFITIKTIIGDNPFAFGLGLAAALAASYAISKVMDVNVFAHFYNIMLNLIAFFFIFFGNMTNKILAIFLTIIKVILFIIKNFIFLIVFIFKIILQFWFLPALHHQDDLITENNNIYLLPTTQHKQLPLTNQPLLLPPKNNNLEKGKK